MNDSLPRELLQILLETPELRDAFLVGGCVRDWLLQIPHKDYDIEVFGVDYERLVSALQKWGKVDLVGRSFGVVKLTTRSRTTFDFTLPRRDSKAAPGHKGFTITFQADLTPQEAAARRDYTINSLMWDPQEQKLLDFFGGERDLRAGVLRHTSSAFPEDPLRVLRGMQFAARFNLRPAPETISLCQSIKQTHAELAKERIREEWFKWAGQSKTPSLGLQFLAETEWIDHYPEIKALRDTPQDPLWHPEGDVFRHTCHCCDAMAALPAWQQADIASRIVYMFAVLTHDFGKAIKTHETIRHGEKRIVSPGHEEASAPLAEEFFNRMNAPRAIRERVLPLIVNHMAHYQKVTDRAVRRLAKRLEPENIEGLLIVMTADSMGRPPRPAKVPATVHALAEKARELAVHEEAPRPILLGRHLLAMGQKPGPEIGHLLHAAYDAQLAGEFNDLPSAIAWLARAYPDYVPPEILTALRNGRPFAIGGEEVQVESRPEDSA